MKEAIQKLIDDHMCVASQYEAVGDASGAAKLRAVANMVACLLDGREPGTILPPLTEEDKGEIRAREFDINSWNESFDAENAGKYDWEEQISYEEAAHRTIAVILSKPKEASLRSWLRGVKDAVEHLIAVCDYTMQTRSKR